MARRLIGLDIGTNAVTIAEVTPGTPPRLDLFAQVALPREAMREGEVADEAAVTDAVARLRSEVGLKRAAVRVGIASPRVVVRQVEMPVMTRDELASALQFQAGDLIPIPTEEAVLDFTILGETPGSGEGGEPTMQVLLAAAYEATVTRLVNAVEAGGLQVAAVDLVPLALTRALAVPTPALVTAGAGGEVVEAHGAQGIVSFGGGVTSIAVHENGVARFVRVLGSGGRELTDAIASDLDVPFETAEALKRALGQPQTDDMVIRARAAVDRPLSVLLDEVRSSIDYFRNQPGSARLERVVVTGGSAQLPGLAERMAALVGVPVEPAFMHELLRVGDIGFPADELPRLEPYLPAAVGLALGGAHGTVIDLLPRNRPRAKSSSGPKLNQKMVAGVLAGVVVLGGLTYLGRKSASDAKAKQAAAEQDLQAVQSQLAALQAQGGGKDGDALRISVGNVLAQDIAWPDFVAKIGNQLPAGIWLTSLQAQRTVEAPKKSASSARSSSTSATDTAAKAGAKSSAAANTGADEGGKRSPASDVPVVASPVAANGSVQCAAIVAPAGSIAITGVARDYPTLAAFVDVLKKNTDVANAWPASAQKGVVGDTEMVSFTVNAVLGETARGHRLEKFFKEQPCK
jgi:type IV pilus assembly protein PilM